MAECPHDRVVLAEGGYERIWAWETNEDGTHTAVFSGVNDFSDDGDGSYYLYCRTCLTRFPVPDEEWEWD